MTDTNVIKLAQPGTFTDTLTEILRNGARALLTQAVETEVADFLGRYADLKTEAGHRASKRDCDVCPLKMQCCPKEPARKVPRSIYEEARDVARACAKTEAYVQSRRDRKKIEMLFAHLKRILRLDRLRLRGPSGAAFEFTLAAIAQNLKRLAKLVARPPPVTSIACAA